LKARHEADGAYKLAASARAREEDAKVRERDMEAHLRATEEERRLIEIVVHEYADLVRSLEGRKSSIGNGSALLQNGSASASSLTLVEGFSEGKSSLHRLMSEFASESEKRESTITQLHDQIANLESVLDSERKTVAQHRAQLAETQVELATLKLDDTTAAKMVSRYMYVLLLSYCF
jgi:methyl-accepting chemotaxis protein